MEYRPPEQALLSCLRATCDIDALLKLDPQSGVSGEDIPSILAQAARFAADRLAPLNRASDQEGASLVGGRVRLPGGVADAYQAFRRDGWASVPFRRDIGGAGLPWALQFALAEMWCAANAAFGQLLMLTQGVVTPLERHGSAWMRKTWLPKLASGAWTGALGMTEPQAGSDLGLVRTRAVPRDGAYAISGQKIFTTFADHDCAENVIHLVLARLPEAPEGISGLSLFAVPTVMVTGEGELGPRNRVRVTTRLIGCRAASLPARARSRSSSIRTFGACCRLCGRL
jgi:alkylation response protein AidB-like acyl-CoA dehydrogenase